VVKVYVVLITIWCVDRWFFCCCCHVCIIPGERNLQYVND
jgi:hypothetical protein